MQNIPALVVVMYLAVTIPAPNSMASEPTGSESLGNQLLDDLAPIVPPTSATKPRDTAMEAGGKDSSSPAQPRFDDLGEDIGQSSGPLSLARVRQGMQRAETLLTPPAATADTQSLQQATSVQKQVVDQLDQLIAELSKQCQGACASSQPKPSESQRSQPKPGKPGSTAGRGQAPARDSTDRLESAGAQPADKGQIEALVKDLWGHLPERSREQMLQSFSHEFLPKYELEIEEYYRRLSEEQQQDSARQ